MDIKTEDYEKLGTFYLGREYDLRNKELQDELVLYDSKDLVTHGVVLGMTGSGKTGLCMALLEEAIIDGIPAVIIDPKGDIANLMLTFPDLKGEDFRPWINEDDAAKKGKTPDEFAQAQADMWRKGLGDWGQSPDRIQKLRDAAEVTIYTPGSNAGIPVSILSSLDAPPFEIIDDAELFGDRIESTVTSLLSLIDIVADPIQSKEHILMSTIFSTCWQQEQNLDLEKLIHHIQSPPFDKIGVLGLESFYPEKKRFELAMSINNLLAAPGFSTWLTGEALDMKKMMYGPDGKARVAIFSIAHLGDTERMFFVSLLLNQMLSWMRAQSGTTSLRALLYMDEIYGYLPPTANPPSKKPMMTMLKQARAFGLGVLLATQNPVDLDYKALSNIGTWFLGRLQTERDKMRVLDGLEGAAAQQDGGFNRRAMEETLAGLGTRVFLLNNVNEDAPVTFHVRWVMSYLRGPMTRGQIRKIMKPQIEALKKSNESRPAAVTEAPKAARAEAPGKKFADTTGRPVLPGSIQQYFAPIRDQIEGGKLIYLPAIVRSASVYISEPKMEIDGAKDETQLTKLGPNDERPEFSQSIKFPWPAAKFDQDPANGAHFADLPGFAMNPKDYTQWGDDFVDEIYRTGGLEVFSSPTLGAYSRPGEDETDFRIRLGDRARERRDEVVESLRESYAKKVARVESKLETAMRKVDEQKSQASSAKLKTAVSIGSTILGALFGRKSVSRTSLGSSSSSATRAWKEGRDVKIAEEQAEELQKEIEQIEEELRREVEDIRSKIDPMTENLETVKIKPLKKNIALKAIGLAWLPYYRVSEFELKAAWQE